MLTPEEFKILSLQYAEQVQLYAKEIRKAREKLRYLRMEKRSWENKAAMLLNTELFEEYEPKVRKN